MTSCGHIGKGCFDGRRQCATRLETRNLSQLVTQASKIADSISASGGGVICWMKQFEPPTNGI